MNGQLQLVILLLLIDRGFVLVIAIKETVLNERSVPVVDYFTPALHLTTLVCSFLDSSNCDDECQIFVF